MKAKFLLLLFYISFSVAKSQQWNWAVNYSDGQQNSVGALGGIDNRHDLYFTTYSNLLYKCSSTGSLLWKKPLGNMSGFPATDVNGNTYIVGSSLQKLDNSGSTLWTTTPTSNIASDTCIFRAITIHPAGGVVIVGKTISNNSQSIIIRYDQNGQVIWKKVDEFYPGAMVVTTNSTGEIYVAGDGKLDSASGNKGWIVKYSSSGSLIYSRVIPAEIYGLCIDKSNGIYLSGWFSSNPINIDGTIYSSSSSSPVPGFLVKYDDLGNVLWYKIFNGVHSKAKPIMTDSSGNLYLATAYSAIQMDNLNFTSPVANAACHLVMKLDSSGNVSWSKHSNPGSSGADATAVFIAIYENDVYTGGSMTGNNSFDGFQLSQSSTYSDILLTKVGQANPEGISFMHTDESATLSLFPNPTSRTVSVSLVSKLPCDVTIEMVNETGAILFSEQKRFVAAYTKAIDVYSLAAGVYFIRARTPHKELVRKLIVN